MTTTRTRLAMIGAAIAALVAPLTLAVLATPAQAAPDRRAHHLETYRLEKLVELEGGEGAWATLRCRSGDFAVDGTWRVDNVDDPNPQLGMFGDERDVLTLASYGETEPRTWRFRFHNGADGRAQLKIFLVCLQGRTVKQWGHRHQLSAQPRVDTVLSDVGEAPVTYSTGNACGPNFVLVAPGFKVEDGSARNFRSWPTSNLRGWSWAFDSFDATTDISVYTRCLNVRTSVNRGHRHRVLTNFTHGYNGSYLALPASSRYERQLTCDQHYWGAVGAWWINVGHEKHLFHLGSDPRPVTRAHFFWNQVHGLGNYLTLRCLGKRTGHGFS